MRVRIHFHKTEAMRFTGHLDLHKAWERALRRAGSRSALRLAYSQGFHPQPRIHLACALPLGFTSECEVVDVWLENEISLVEIMSGLAPSLPPGIHITGIEAVSQDEPALQTQVKSAEYRITCLDPLPDLGLIVDELLASDALPRERRGKNYDLRPFIEAMQVITEPGQAAVSVIVKLAARENATGRPEEVVAAMGLNPANARYHRTRLLF